MITHHHSKEPTSGHGLPLYRLVSHNYSSSTTACFGDTKLIQNALEPQQGYYSIFHLFTTVDSSVPPAGSAATIRLGTNT